MLRCCHSASDLNGDAIRLCYGRLLPWIGGRFLLLTVRRQRTLLHLLLSGIAFAVANQLGNAGYDLSGVILIIAGIAYAIIIVRAEKAD
jgi:hypothetical protein